MASVSGSGSIVTSFVHDIFQYASWTPVATPDNTLSFAIQQGDIRIEFSGAGLGAYSGIFATSGAVSTIEFYDWNGSDWILGATWSDVNADAADLAAAVANSDHAAGDAAYAEAIFGSADILIGGGTLGDQLYGYGGDDVISGTSLPRNLYGGDGVDTLLLGEGSLNFSGMTLSGFERLTFSPAGGSVDFSSSQLGGGGLSNSLVVTGSIAGDNIRIEMVDHAIDLSGWTFVQWDSQDRVQITGTDTADTIIGTTGSDFISDLGGADTVYAGAGSDLIGGDGADNMYGGVDNDVFQVTAGDRVFEFAGEGSSDGVRAFINNYVLPANVENLTLMSVTSGQMPLTGTGNALNNTINGNASNNKLYGLAGADRLSGLDGADVLIGGAGRDTLRGGLGQDKFVFNIKQTAANADTIADFTHAKDKFQLENSVFKALGPATGALVANKFFVGANAHDADDRVIYNSRTGALYYDADGAGGSAKLLIATLATHPALSASDIQII
jgi:hypothetical protein